MKLGKNPRFRGNYQLKDFAYQTNRLIIHAVTLFNPLGESFKLARYHDVDYEQHGPAALAAFLGLPLEAIFPMRYDVSDIASGHGDCLRRSIPAVPASRLSDDALIQLALR